MVLNMAQNTAPNETFEQKLKRQEGLARVTNLQNLFGAQAMLDAFGDSALQQAFSAEKHEPNALENSYVTRHMEEIADDYQNAVDDHLVFKVSLGPELTLYLTPQDALEHFAKELPFSNVQNDNGVYTLITPEKALEELRSEDIHPINQSYHDKVVANIENYAQSYTDIKQELIAG